MKNRIYHVAFKSFCVILAAISFVCSVACAFCFALMLAKGGYQKSYEQLYQNELEGEYSWLPQEIAHRYYVFLYESSDAETGTRFEFFSWLQSFRAEYGFDCTIQNEDGKMVYSDHLDGDYVFSLDMTVSVGGDWTVVDSESKYQVYTPIEYQVSVYVEEPELGNNAETKLWLITLAYHFKTAAIPIFCVALLLFAVCMIFLCCAAGREAPGAPIRENFFDRLPFELYLLFGIFAFLIQVWFLEITDVFWLFLFFVGIFFCVDALLCILVILTLSTRIKTGHLFRNTLTYLVTDLFKKLIENMKLVPKIVLILSAVAVFDLFLSTFLDFPEFLAAVLIEGLVLAGILVWYGASIQRLYQDQAHLSRGELDHRCDPSRLPPGLRSFGEELNRSAEGLERAAEEKIKSERFKTELITNVSHDIKTPLTSIVNYVDLMKKEEPENEKIKEYLEVLERQSTRLKKLTEDLVESSKAASGVLSVELAPLDAKVLLEQALAEYQPGFEEKGLDPVCCFSSTPAFILADGKRLWRVLDNLLNNICKYALDGTRVYCTLDVTQDQVFMIFRNISASPLSVSGEELTERFVRGDASRNTEGSGLGLAIARSFVELQKGNMELFVDGDLFRVTLRFDRIQ